MAPGTMGRESRDLKWVQAKVYMRPDGNTQGSERLKEDMLMAYFGGYADSPGQCNCFCG